MDDVLIKSVLSRICTEVPRHLERTAFNDDRGHLAVYVALGYLRSGRKVEPVHHPRELGPDYLTGESATVVRKLLSGVVPLSHAGICSPKINFGSSRGRNRYAEARDCHGFRNEKLARTPHPHGIGKL